MRRIVAVVLLLASGVSARGDGYPRIANLWGCSPTVTDYAKWARYSLLVINGGPAADTRRFRAEMRKRNPRQIVLGTGMVSYTGSPAQTPWMKDEWYLRRPSGEKVAWWAGQAYVPNLFDDACFEALVEQTEKTYGDLLRDGTLDGVFYDSMVGGVTWLGEVDTDRNRKADRAEDVDARWHDRQNVFLDRVRQRYPKMLILANDIDAGHAPHLNGRLYEGAPLLDRITTGVLLPEDAIRTLDTWMSTTLKPAVTFAIMTHPLGWQGWRVGQGDKITTPGEVDRVRRDFARMRLGLTTALMTDAYYAYDFGTVWYGLPLWYAEYDAPLGKPLGPGRQVYEVPPMSCIDWHAGQATKAFVIEPMSKATPQGVHGEMTDPDGGWQRLFATDQRQLKLEPGKHYRIDADVEVTRKTNRAFQFDVRTPKGGWEKHDKANTTGGGDVGSIWHIAVNMVPDDFDDYQLEWHVLGSGGLRLKSLKVELIGQSYFLREFEGGIALLNPLPQPVTVKLPRSMKRLRDAEAPLYAVEVDDGDAGFRATGAWAERAGETRFYGAGFRVSPKPGSSAAWSFTAPSSDTYTLFVTAPGGKVYTDAAEYSLVAPRSGQAATVDQRKCDGGWVRLFSAKLKQGQRCTVRLRSAGTGATVADAIRAESAARYNDGAAATSVTLPARDGIVLLNR